MKITAYKCPDTGEIFEFEKDYLRHRRRIQRDRQKETKRQRIIDQFDLWLKNEKENLTSPDMLADWFMENQRVLMDHYNFLRPNRIDGRFYATDRYINVRISLKYSSQVSNTHCCPPGGVTNWWRHKEHPLGYPGWQGEITGTLEREEKHNWKYPTSDLFEMIGVYCGSGGGGNEKWSYYGSIFFDALWPQLTQHRALDVLKGI